MNHKKSKSLLGVKIPDNFTLKAYEATFLRSFLSTERLIPELAIIRNKYTREILIPALKPIDEAVNQNRESLAERTPDQKLRTDANGMIEYGVNKNIAMTKFQEILDTDVIIPIRDAAEFLQIRDMLNGSIQLIDEDSTEAYIVVKEKLNDIYIPQVKF